MGGWCLRERSHVSGMRNALFEAPQGLFTWEILVALMTLVSPYIYFLLVGSTSHIISVVPSGKNSISLESLTHGRMVWS